MYYFLHNTEPVIRWSIYKGPSNVKEDLRRSQLKIFAVACDNVFPIAGYRIDGDGAVVFSLPSYLPVGTYALRAVWAKNGIKAAGLTGGKVGRDISISQVDSAYFITDNMADPICTHPAEVKSMVANYGYDGMSAYELAVFLGKTLADEQSWIENMTSKDVPLDFKTLGYGEGGRIQVMDHSIGQDKLAEDVLVEAIPDSDINELFN